MSTTNSLTKATINLFNMNGYCVWRNNNGAIYSAKRKCYLKNPNHKLGVTDIIGYKKKCGTSVFLEIKTGKDKLSPEQIEFMYNAKLNNCISYQIKNIQDALNIIETTQLK